MAVDIGPKIGIEGEAKFRQELNNVNQAVKTLGSEMKAVTAEFTGQEKSMEALTKKNDVLGRSISTLEDKLALQQKALQESAEKYGEADTRTMKWQQAVNETTAAINKAEAEYKENAKAIDEIGDEAEETGKQIEDAGKKGSGFGKAIKAGAAAAAAAFAAVTAAAVKVGKEVFNMAKETAAYGDEIDKNSQKVGLSAEAYQKWDYAMKISGTEMSAATTGLKTLTNKFDDAKNGSKGAIETFDRLGLSMDEISNLSREELFETTVKALQNVTDETEKAALANDLFGKSGQDLMPMFNMTEEGLQAVMDEADKYGMVMSEDAVKASAAFTDSMTKLKGTFAGFKNQVAGSLMPGLTMITDGLSDLMIGSKDAGPKIREGFSQVISQLTNMIPKFAELISTIAGAVLEQAPAILTALANGILAALPTLLPIAIEVFKTLQMGFTQMLPELITAGFEVITSLINGIVETLPDLIPVAIDSIITIVETLIDNVDMLVDAAIAITLALADGLINALPKLLEKAPEIIQKLVAAIINNAGKLVEAAMEIIVKLVAGIVGNLPKIVESAATIIATLLKGLADGFKKFVDVGKNIVDGVWQGIKNAAATFTANVKNFFKNIVDSVKKALGIKSPSKVFAGIGSNMVAGLEQGWDSEFSNVQRSIDDSMNSLTPSASVAVNASASGGDITGAVKMALSGAAVYLDGNKVGKIIFTRQNNETIARGMSPVYA